MSCLIEREREREREGAKTKIWIVDLSSTFAFTGFTLGDDSHSILIVNKSNHCLKVLESTFEWKKEKKLKHNSLLPASLLGM